MTTELPQTAGFDLAPALDCSLEDLDFGFTALCTSTPIPADTDFLEAQMTLNTLPHIWMGMTMSRLEVPAEMFAQLDRMLVLVNETRRYSLKYKQACDAYLAQRENANAEPQRQEQTSMDDDFEFMVDCMLDDLLQNERQDMQRNHSHGRDEPVSQAEDTEEEGLVPAVQRRQIARPQKKRRRDRRRALWARRAASCSSHTTDSSGRRERSASRSPDAGYVGSCSSRSVSPPAANERRRRSRRNAAKPRRALRRRAAVVRQRPLAHGFLRAAMRGPTNGFAFVPCVSGLLVPIQPPGYGRPPLSFVPSFNGFSVVPSANSFMGVGGPQVYRPFVNVVGPQWCGYPPINIMPPANGFQGLVGPPAYGRPSIHLVEPRGFYLNPVSRPPPLTAAVLLPARFVRPVFLSARAASTFHGMAYYIP